MIDATTTYRRPPDLGRCVRPPAPSFWEPPRCANPWEDPYLLSKVFTGLRHLYRTEAHRETGRPPRPRHPVRYGRTHGGRGEPTHQRRPVPGTPARVPPHCGDGS
jgi:hypothetical protein